MLHTKGTTILITIDSFSKPRRPENNGKTSSECKQK